VTLTHLTVCRPLRHPVAIAERLTLWPQSARLAQRRSGIALGLGARHPALQIDDASGFLAVGHHWFRIEVTLLVKMTKPFMDERSKSLRPQLLEWLISHPRTYSETMDAWRTSCPRLSIWEDACIDGLIESETGTPFITVSTKGLVYLQKNRQD
jgi:hypothetical protein